MADETSETRNNARLAILELANMISVPMSLNAIVRLNVADAIWQSGSNIPLSASEILTRVHQPTGDPENLQRILRMLTSYDVFTEHIINSSERKYSLTDVGKTLVTDHEGLSYGSYVLQHHQDALVRSWPLVHEAVLDSSVEPFVKANGGESAYGYYGENHEMNELMQKAMSGVSVPFMKAILNGYDGFEGVSKLVDVGGSAGDCLKMILQKYPHVKEGINFDLPEVVAKAPNISARCCHLQWVLTTWTDDECKSIMKNCYEALPKGGKLIACEPVLPHESDSSHRTRALLEGDIFVMTIYRAKGKHRTEEEFGQLGNLTGFAKFRAIYIDHFYTVLEFTK
ncbi:Nicotinate N-methyltransferase 1 [Ranunculus cassubicifolius]